MINTLHIGPAHGSNRSAQVNDIPKRADGDRRSEAGASDFAKFLTAVLQEIDGASPDARVTGDAHHRDAVKPDPKTAK